MTRRAGCSCSRMPRSSRSFARLPLDWMRNPARAPTETGARVVDEIFADISRNKLVAAQKTLAHLQSGAGARPFINAARRFLFLKGTDSHDYKFSAAALEDYYHVAPAVRDRYLAASVF